jgi:hypothetical protein
MNKEFIHQNQNNNEDGEQNKYDEDGELILDPETKADFDALAGIAKNIHAETYLVFNKLSELNPSDRKKALKELLAQYQTTLESIRELQK